MHLFTFQPPVKREWMIDHSMPIPNKVNDFGIVQGNTSGSLNAYMPYTTTKPKVESWVPPSK